MTEPTLPVTGARVLALIGAVCALLTMSLPWAYEENLVRIDTPNADVTVVERGSVEWTGWTLHGASRLDGHHPVSLVVFLLFVIGTVALLAGAWLTFERGHRLWIPRTVALVAAALLVVSFPLLSDIAGTFGEGHVTTTRYGIIAWRVSVLVCLLGALRQLVLFERPTRD
jgi:hypothetical protein